MNGSFRKTISKGGRESIDSLGGRVYGDLRDTLGLREGPEGEV